MDGTTTATPPDDSGTTLGDHLRRARLNAGLEQEDLARKVGVARATISNWERGISYPTVPLWRKAAEATGAIRLLDLRVLPSGCTCGTPDRTCPVHGPSPAGYAGPERRGGYIEGPVNDLDESLRECFA